MKRFLYPILITMFVIIFILLLPSILPQREVVKFSDDALKEKALSIGMLPTPKTYKELLKVVDTSSNPISRDKIALGRELFNDKRLSLDMSISCATCHKLKEGGDDNLATAIGYKSRANPHHLNSPTVLNIAIAKSLFWDGSAEDLEHQANGPITASFEMSITPQEIERRLNQDISYVQKFKSIFNEQNITYENLLKAISVYERTLFTRGDYDKFLDGNSSAMSIQAKRGMALFITKGCKGCHSGMSLGGESVQKFPLRSYLFDYIGITDNLKRKESPFPFENIGGFLGRDGTLKFRVPILRNITKTAPYFHNGAVDKLEEAVRLMSKYQLGYEFDKAQIADVVEFLKTLDGELIEY
ncbi:MAG: cytochrome c peroxidase [Sulfurovum sp.]